MVMARFEAVERLKSGRPPKVVAQLKSKRHNIDAVSVEFVVSCLNQIGTLMTMFRLRFTSVPHSVRASHHRTYDAFVGNTRSQPSTSVSTAWMSGGRSATEAQADCSFHTASSEQSPTPMA